MDKILFNDEFGLTDAVIGGRKTMTRREVNQGLIERCEKRYKSFDHLLYSNTESREISFEEFKEGYLLGLSRFKKDSTVAIAQCYNNVCSYLARMGKTAEIDFIKANVKSDSLGWTNKLFVSSMLMPKRIRITDIRLEHLQDITEEDCLKEGCYEDNGQFFYLGCKKTFYTAREAFSDLINKVSNNRNFWKSNPLVYVYDFELEDN